MTWVKFESRFPMHRKVRKLSDAAFRLNVSAVCWALDMGTDGFIPADDLDLVSDVRRPHAAAAELVARDLWHPVNLDTTSNTTDLVGWTIHDFLDYQPTAADVARRKAEAAERQRRHRESHRDTTTGRITTPP